VAGDLEAGDLHEHGDRLAVPLRGAVQRGDLVGAERTESGTEPGIVSLRRGHGVGYRSNSMSLAMTVPRSTRSWRALIVLPVAALAVGAAAVVGVRGLTADPVRAVAPDGTASLDGSFEPVDCAGCVQGYVQAGARSVFVLLPAGCAAPAREAQISVMGRLAPDLGPRAYRATGCAAPGG